jgi:hypothetical protein
LVAPKRRFPPPWTVEEYNDACFIVRDKNGQRLGYFYFEEEPGRRTAANLLFEVEVDPFTAGVATLQIARCAPTSPALAQRNPCVQVVIAKLLRKRQPLHLRG